MDRKTIKILVVEDEILLLRNIRKKITAVSEDFQIIGEAFNGKEALEIIEHNAPDIVFTDIRMPIMDGLELSKILHTKYPEIYTVIVTGYNDFDYARTALCYRVHDYLLKPLKSEELTRLLNTLKTKIITQRDAEFHLFLEKLLNGQSFTVDISECTPYRDRTFTCFMVCFGNLLTHSHSAIEKKEQANSLIPVSWEALFASAPFTISDHWFFPQQFYNIQLILVENLNTDGKTAGLFLYTNLMRLVPQTNINLVYSQRPVSPSELHTERISLRRKLFSSLRIGRSAIFAPDEAPEILPPSVLPATVVNHLYSLVLANNKGGFAETIRQLFTEWDEHQYPQQWIEKVLLQIFTILQQGLYFSDEDYEKMQSTIFYNLETSTGLSAAADGVNSEFLYWITLNKSVPTEIETVIDEMDCYIRFHYKESITISELAEKYHFNHSYLTRVFKKQKGQSPLKLINELRIKDAKKLLETTSLSIREISSMLGFTDQHYFSRIFREVTGQTPKEYRYEKT